LFRNYWGNGNHLSAQTFTNLSAFNYTDGSSPNGALVQATTESLRDNLGRRGQRLWHLFVIASGTVTHCTVSTPATAPTRIKPGPGFQRKLLWNDVWRRGQQPGTVSKSPRRGGDYVVQLQFLRWNLSVAGLVQGTDGTSTDNLPGRGQQLWAVSNHPAGTLTTLHSFSSRMAPPECDLGTSHNGNFYGTTDTAEPQLWDGFQNTPTGRDTLHSFDYTTVILRAELGSQQWKLLRNNMLGGTDGDARFSKSRRRHADHSAELNGIDGAAPFSRDWHREPMELLRDHSVTATTTVAPFLKSPRGTADHAP